MNASSERKRQLITQQHKRSEELQHACIQGDACMQVLQGRLHDPGDCIGRGILLEGRGKARRRLDFKVVSALSPSSGKGTSFLALTSGISADSGACSLGLSHAHGVSHRRDKVYSQISAK